MSTAALSLLAFTDQEKTRLRLAIDRIDPRAVNVPPQSWWAKNGHRAIMLRLVDGPQNAHELQKEFGTKSDRDVLGSKLRHLKRQRLTESQRNYVRGEPTGHNQRPASWWLLRDGVLSKAEAEMEPVLPLEQLPADKQRALNEMDWAGLGFKGHEAWRLANVLAYYELNPRATRVQVSEAFAADRVTAGKWRLRLARNRRGKLLKPRYRTTTSGAKVRDGWRVDWQLARRHHNPEHAGRKLAPERVTTSHSLVGVKLDRRTDEERAWCDGLTAEDLNLTPGEFVTFIRLWKVTGTVDFATCDELVARMDRASNRAIHRALPSFKREKLVTVTPKAGGDNGRKSKWEIGAEKVKRIYLLKRPAASNSASTPRASIEAGVKTVRIYREKLKSGPKTNANDAMCREVLKLQNDFGISRQAAYKKYQAAHAGTPDRTPEAIEQLFRRFRKRAAK